jgi:hypothetical protein
MMEVAFSADQRGGFNYSAHAAGTNQWLTKKLKHGMHPGE